MSLKLFDLDTITDTDLAEMMDKEVACDIPRMVDPGTALPWCTETATHWVLLSCRKCGRSRRLLTCLPCAKLVSKALRILGVVLIPLKKSRHGCRRPVTFRVRVGSLT